MITLQDIKNLFFKDYKSYKKEADIYIPEISDFNVIIGKNNTGKTSFIDIIDFITNSDEFIDKQKYILPKAHFTVRIDKEHNIKLFEQNINKEGTLSYNEENLRISLDGKDISGYCPYKKSMEAYLGKDGVNLQPLLELYKQELSRYKILRISAERDIRPEPENKILNLKENGEGATNIVRAIITQTDYDERIIEDYLLQELNKIMGNDAIFSRIQVKQSYESKLFDPKDVWEIFLEEKDAGRFALSKSGSGLKTIILVLLNLLVIPFLPENNGKNLIYAFEELENNLHPALQRRLFDYLYNFAVGKNIPVFLTTHSHVAIDMFASKPGAQVLHVTKENHESKIKKVESFFDKKAILDDLAVKASDLFQANGIIWVEGPSDRIYINKWLEVFCNSKYQEGRDFQYLYYGGRLLSHYCLDDDKELMQQHGKSTNLRDLFQSSNRYTDLESKINILTTNHNSAIVVDSDKKQDTDNINDTKKRIEREFSKKQLFCWITKGKEIENYLSLESINKAVSVTIENQCGQFELFPEYIKSSYNSFTHKKVEFAREVSKHITKENILDLEKQIKELYKQIEKWNSN